ncbi:MAG: metallophosphoesterase [Candidatus Sericytochromatia bacterium]|nr:metallophosphoesterase [Candidatus Sericytochromatia bacterium]
MLVLNRRRFLSACAASALGMTLPLPRLAEARPSERGEGVIRFAHVTDLHFTRRVQPRYPESHRQVGRAVFELNAQDLDFVLFTGDMFHFPEDLSEEAEALRDLLRCLRHPYYCLFGNHDVEGNGLRERKRFLIRQLGDGGLAQGEGWYTFSPTAGIRFVAIDTTDTDGDAYSGWAGFLGPRQKTWLQATIQRHRDEALILAMHHPPLMPYPFLDRLRFNAADSVWLSHLVATHPQIQLVLAGHYHFAACDALRHAAVLIGPSLVEYPHAYRVFELGSPGPDGRAWLQYQWHRLARTEAFTPDLATSRAALRGLGLQGLSYGHSGGRWLKIPG